MAECLYNKYTDSSDAKSAGVGYNIGYRYSHPTSDVITVMHEENLDVSRNIVKSATQKMVDDADAVVVMCDLDDCPKFLLDSRKFKHIPIPDPYGISVEYTRTVRDEIKRMVLDLLHSD